MAAPGGHEPARAGGEVTEGRFPLLACGGGRLVEGAIIVDDKDLDCRGLCEGDALLFV